MSDPLLPGLSGPTESGTVNGSLDVGETWVYTGSYAVTQADIDSNGTVEVGDLGAGFIDNTVTSTTTEVPTPQTSVVNTPLSQAGSYTVAKAATGIDTAGNGIIDAAGDVIDYTVTVVNTGNQTLTGVSVSSVVAGPVRSDRVGNCQRQSRCGRDLGLHRFMGGDAGRYRFEWHRRSRRFGCGVH